MTSVEFNKIIEQQWARCVRTLVQKADEYAVDSDRLHNFKQAATLEQCTEEQALIGMLTKHIISIYDMIKTEREYSEHIWNEKITDALNYFFILRALIEETHRSLPIQRLIGEKN